MVGSHFSPAKGKTIFNIPPGALRTLFSVQLIQTCKCNNYFHLSIYPAVETNFTSALKEQLCDSIS